jgi:hypothetical protein
VKRCAVFGIKGLVPCRAALSYGAFIEIALGRTPLFSAWIDSPVLDALLLPTIPDCGASSTLFSAAITGSVVRRFIAVNNGKFVVMDEALRKPVVAGSGAPGVLTSLTFSVL